MHGARRVFEHGTWALVLPGVALLATVLLAWQAYDAAVTHRAASESVLRDYAGLAAAELVRRAASEVGYQGHYPLLQAIAERGGDWRSREAADPRLRRAAGLARRSFSAELASRGVAFHDARDPSAEAWIAVRLGAVQEGQPFHVLRGEVAGEPRMFVLAAPRDGRSCGFELEPKALSSFVAAAFERGPLLPASLGGGRVGNDRLAVVVHDEGRHVLLRRGTGWGTKLGASLPFGPAYAGVLDGFIAEVEVDPAAAGALIIGGLPGSRLPQILALLILAGGLLTMAFYVLARQRALERLRAEFVASASHELRTPVAQLRLFAETLRLGRVRSEDDRQRCLEILAREAQRLGHLVENLLQFSRAGHAARALAPAARELAPLVSEAVELLRPRATSVGARLNARLAPRLRARVDADAWRQVLLNLLDNAFKYGPPGQEVTVTLEEAGSRVRLAVEDEGPGIPAAERERVFEGFHRLARDRSSHVTGTGLGLAVVRELVLGHAGSCRAEAGARGGARLVVELPREGDDP